MLCRAGSSCKGVQGGGAKEKLRSKIKIDMKLLPSQVGDANRSKNVNSRYNKKPLEGFQK